MYKVKSLLWTRYPSSFLVDGSEIRKSKAITAFPAEKIFSVWSLTSVSHDDLYDPFTFYGQNVSNDVITDILIDNRCTHKLHTLCASIDHNNFKQVEAFVKHFGFLDYVISPDLDKKINKAAKPNIDFVVLEKLKHLQFSMQVFRAVVYLISLTFKKSEEINFEEVMQFVPQKVYAALEYDKHFYIGGEERPAYKDFLNFSSCSSHTEYLWNLINQHLNERLKRTPGKLDKSDNCQINFYFDCNQKDLHGYSDSDNNLLDALYLMIVLDLIAAKRQIKLCADHICNNFFVTGKPKSIFCSEQCRSRIAMARYHKKKSLRKN